MIVAINTVNLAVSEYSPTGVVDLASVSGNLYYATSTSINMLSSEGDAVTGTILTGKISFGDNSPKRFKHLELTCHEPTSTINVYQEIDSTNIQAIDSTRHTDVVRGYRLPSVKVTHLQLKAVGSGASGFNITDLTVLPVDTLVKK